MQHRRFFKLSPVHYPNRVSYCRMLLIALLMGLMGCQPPDGANPMVVANTLPNSLNVLVWGDWGIRGLLHQQAVADQMEHYASAISPRFMISTGDNFYLNGVSSVTDNQWQQSFEQVYNGVHLQIPVKAVLGNHDYEQVGSAQAEVDYTRQNTRWQMPARYFTEVVPVNSRTSVRLVHIDTNPFIEAYQQNPAGYPSLAEADTRRQLAWIDSVLAHTPEPWKIVVGHHPIRSVGTDHGDQPELVRQLQPLLTKYGVQAYLCGHSHTLQHLTTGGTTDYIISGGGGAPLGGVAPAPPARFAVAVGGFAVVSVNTDSLRVSFIDAAGLVRYRMQRGR